MSAQKQTKRKAERQAAKLMAALEREHQRHAERAGDESDLQLPSPSRPAPPSASRSTGKAEPGQRP